MIFYSNKFKILYSIISVLVFICKIVIIPSDHLLCQKKLLIKNQMYLKSQNIISITDKLMLISLTDKLMFIYITNIYVTDI